jgi:hypothetical protein
MPTLLASPRLEPFSFLLEGDWSLSVSSPERVICSWGDEIHILGKKKIRANPFDVLKEELRKRTGSDGIAVGIFGYDLRTFIEEVPQSKPADLPFPDMLVAFYPGRSSPTTIRSPPRPRRARRPAASGSAASVSKTGSGRPSHKRGSSS